MSDSKEDLIKVVTTGAMISVLAGLARALIVKTEPILMRIRTFFAGVVLGILGALIMRNTNINEFYKEMIIAILTGFGCSLWPIAEKGLEKWLSKWMNKKGGQVDDILHDNKP